MSAQRALARAGTEAVGQETRPTLVKSGGGPTRCPTCQEEVRREEPTWIACEACLVRHHAACWRDACTSCGEKNGLRPEPTSPTSGASGATAGPDSAPATAAVPPTAGRPPAVRALLPALELSVGDGATSPAEVSLRIATGRDRPEPFLVSVRNASDEPQRVELRKLPPWLRVDGAAEREIAPGATEGFRVLLDPRAAEFATRSLGEGNDGAPKDSPGRGLFGTRLKTSRNPDLSLDSAFDGIVRGRFVVSSPDRAWTVTLKAYRDPSARSLLGNAGLLVMIPPLGLALTLAMLYLGLPPWRRAGESDASICYRRRAARSCRLQSLALAFVGASIVGLIVLAQSLSG